jgi:hypothetical protein
MSDFTYAFESRSEVLEKYEWDNVWWESTDVANVPRVLYIGDSISCATRKIATKVSGASLLFDGLGTSKAVDNPYFAPTIRSFASQQGGRAAVLFNNGLHGWHLDDRTEYRENYEKLLKFILSEFESTPVFIVLTTAVADPERDARVKERNKVVCELAEIYGLPVIDLYSVTDSHRDLISADGVHLSPEGYELLAKKLVQQVGDVLCRNA